jgi:hypothetical protein
MYRRLMIFHGSYIIIDEVDSLPNPIFCPDLFPEGSRPLAHRRIGHSLVDGYGAGHKKIRP